MRPDLRAEARYALRAFRRQPAFATGIILTFALAIGVNATMFGLVSRLMLSPPPGIRDADAVARIGYRHLTEDGEEFVMSTGSYPAFRAVQSVSGAFDVVAASRADSVTVGSGTELSRVAALGVSGEYFHLLGAAPMLGRLIAASDDAGAAGGRVVVLGHGYWRMAFGGDRGVIGREIVLDDQPFTIVGVAPPGFNGDGQSAIALYVPLSSTMPDGNAWQSNHGMNIVSLIVRLRRGVTPAMASAMAHGAMVAESDAAGSVSVPRLDIVSVVPGSEARQSPQAKIALWLTAVSLVVLLVAIANAGTLLSLRAARRRREIAVRVVMGAGYGDLARGLLTESMLLAMAGAAAGMLLARLFSSLLRATLLPNLAADGSFVSAGVLAAATALALLAGMLAGVVPLAVLRRTDLTSDLKAGGAHGASARLGRHKVLVAVQTALCTVLLAGAALFVRSLQRVQGQDLGFDSKALLYATLEFRGHVAGVERDRAHHEIVRRLNALPGVRASVVQGIPFGPHAIPPLSIPGMTETPNIGGQIPIMYGATPDFLESMRVKLLAGRTIARSDTRGARNVLLVNETMARTIWPGRSPLGQCVRIGFGSFPPQEDGNPADAAPCREVVGVVKDLRARSLRPEGNEDHLMQYYVPFEQLPEPPIPDPQFVNALLIRASGDPARAASQIQRAIREASPLAVYAHVGQYQDLIDPQLRSWRLGARLFTAFGMLALTIAAVGLFGVVSYVVTQRVQEIGIRLALGGPRRGVVGLVIADSLRVVGAGLAIGVAGALALGPLVASMLFQTSPREPASLIAAGSVLLLTALVASAWPAWRASRTDPLVALRADG